MYPIPERSSPLHTTEHEPSPTTTNRIRWKIIKPLHILLFSLLLFLPVIAASPKGQCFKKCGGFKDITAVQNLSPNDVGKKYDMRGKRQVMWSVMPLVSISRSFYGYTNTSDSSKIKDALAECSAVYYELAVAYCECSVCPFGFQISKACGSSQQFAFRWNFMNTKGFTPFYVYSDTECKLCPPGQFQSSIGDLSDKSNITKLTFRNMSQSGGAPANQQCQKCAPGTYSNQKINQAAASNGRWPGAEGICPVCDAGSFCPGGTDQQPCAAGSFSKKGAGSCTTCAAGQFASKKGEVSCHVCNGTEYQNERGQLKCKQCGKNKAGQQTSCVAEDGCKTSGPECSQAPGPCNQTMIGDGICNALECNRFDAFTLDEKGNHVLLTEADAPISLDVGDCSAVMARLITKAQMILEVKPFSRQSRDNAIKILHDAQNYHEPLQQSAVQANASLLCSEDPPALPAIQCSEYFRQKQFYDIAGFMLDRNLNLNRPPKTLVVEGATAWDAWKVRAFSLSLSLSLLLPLAFSVSPSLSPPLPVSVSLSLCASTSVSVSVCH